MPLKSIAVSTQKFPEHQLLQLLHVCEMLAIESSERVNDCSGRALIDVYRQASESADNVFDRCAILVSLALQYGGGHGVTVQSLKDNGIPPQVLQVAEILAVNINAPRNTYIAKLLTNNDAMHCALRIFEVLSHTESITNTELFNRELVLGYVKNIGDIRAVRSFQATCAHRHFLIVSNIHNLLTSAGMLGCSVKMHAQDNKITHDLYLHGTQKTDSLHIAQLTLEANPLTGQLTDTVAVLEDVYTSIISAHSLVRQIEPIPEKIERELNSRKTRFAVYENTIGE